MQLRSTLSTQIATGASFSSCPPGSSELSGHCHPLCSSGSPGASERLNYFNLEYSVCGSATVLRRPQMHSNHVNFWRFCCARCVGWAAPSCPSRWREERKKEVWERRLGEGAGHSQPHSHFLLGPWSGSNPEAVLPACREA